LNIFKERESSSSNFGRTQELAFKDETIDKLEQQLRQYRQQEAELNVSHMAFFVKEYGIFRRNLQLSNGASKKNKR
jgi:hypothetical protein